MPQLTPSSLLLLTGVTSFVMAVWFLFLRQGRFSAIPGIPVWSLGLVLSGVGWVTISLRTALPDLYSAIPGAMLLMPAHLLMVSAFFGALDKVRELRTLWGLLILAELAMFFFTYGIFHTPARMAISAAYELILVFWILFVFPGPAARLSAGLLFSVRAVFGSIALAFALRFSVGILNIGDPQYDSMANTTLNLSMAWLFFAVGQLPAIVFLTLCQEASDGKRSHAEKRLTELVASIDGIVWEADAHTVTFTYVSDKAERLLGYPTADWLQPGFWQKHIYSEDQIWAPEFCRERTNSLEPHEFEYRFVARDGKIVWLRDMVTVVSQAGQARWLRGVMVDVTRRKQDEARLRQLRFMYELLSNCRKTISEETDVQQLFDQLVKLCTDSGDLLLAWIGVVGDDAVSVRVAASAGKADAYLDGITVTLDSESPEGRGPTGRAMRSHRNIVVNYLAINSRDMFTERRQAFGMGSCASIPLLLADNRTGSLNLYAFSEDFFKPEIIELFERLAADVRRALDRWEAERWRNLAEQQMRESRLLLDFALESTIDAVWDFNPINNTVHFTRHWEAMLGYDRGELANDIAIWESHMHPQDRAQADETLRQYLRGELEAFDTIVRMRTKNGTYIWVKDRGIVVERNEKGTPTRIVGTLKNIDCEVRAQETARRNAILLDEVFNAAPVGLAIVDRDRKLIRANAKKLEMTGASNSVELERLQRELIFYHDDGTRYSEGEAPPVISLPDFEKSHGETYGVSVSPDQPIRWVSVSSRYIAPLDVVVRVTIDITELAEAQKALHEMANMLEQKVRLRTLELEEINQELEAFSYSLSHDLKAPLVRAEGWLNIVSQQFRQSIGEKGGEQLQFIRREIAAMTQMCEAMLQLANVSQPALSFARVDLTDVAAQILADLRLEYAESQFETHVAPALEVRADPTLVRVLLRNLLENAVKYSQYRNPAHIEFNATTSYDQATYCISDNGVGFDMQYADRLFAPFQRLHSEKDFPGTGIGLATAQRIVHRHGGKIWAQSQAEHGTSMYFTLPALAGLTD